VGRAYTQYLFPRDLAAGSPFAGNDIGDPQGIFVAKQLDGVNRPVLIDPSYGPQDIDSSGSMGIFGPLGRGKSHFVKLIIAGVLARGGQVVVTDRTQSSEYARLATATAGSAQVVKIGADAEHCLDPMQVFSGHDRRSITIGFLSVLLGTAPLEADGLVLSQAVSAVVERPSARISDVLAVLEARTDNPKAEEVAGKLREMLKTPLGATIFGPSKPVSLDADYIVFAAQGLNLPEREHLMNPTWPGVSCPNRSWPRRCSTWSRPSPGPSRGRRCGVSRSACSTRSGPSPAPWRAKRLSKSRSTTGASTTQR